MIIKFSGQRLMAMIKKEFIQMLRDYGTLVIMIALPLIQLTLFGFAINTNPKSLPATLMAADNSNFTRSFLQAMKNSQYFHFIPPPTTKAEAKRWIEEGKVIFVVNIPPNFTRDLIKGAKPSLLVEADATDPAATSNAIAALVFLANSAINYELQGSLTNLRIKANAPFNTIVHAIYNPLQITQYNIVPGLMGVVLTMTMVVVTGMAITRERERGTMENILSTPLQPLEIMLGKIVPYIMVGYVQVLIILSAAVLIFHVPVQGSLLLLLILCFPYIVATLAVGLTFSTIAQNQLQAMQFSMFFFLPSILLSGFMFPFHGMPQWAQWIGSILPLTHFLVIVRGILLKGNNLSHSWHAIWPILIFILVVMSIALKRFRQTLD